MSVSAQPWLFDILRAMDLAMNQEDVHCDVRERVLNRLLYGDPDGAMARREINEDQNSQKVTPFSAEEAQRRAAALIGQLDRATLPADRVIMGISEVTP